MKTIKVGLILSTQSDHDAIKELVYKSVGTKERKLLYHLNDAIGLVKSGVVDLLVVSDKILNNHHYELITSHSGLVPIVVVLESHPANPPAAFLIFSLLHTNTQANIASSIFHHTMLGGIAYDEHISKLIHQHGNELKSPSSCGLSKRHVEILNEYLCSHSQKAIGEKLEIKSSTVKSTMNTILKKLELESYQDLIPFLRKHHWCNLVNGEVIWF